MLLLLRFRMYTQTPRMARSRQTSVSIEKNACLYFGVAGKEGSRLKDMKSVRKDFKTHHFQGSDLVPSWPCLSGPDSSCTAMAGIRTKRRRYAASRSSSRCSWRCWWLYWLHRTDETSDCVLRSRGSRYSSDTDCTADSKSHEDSTQPESVLRYPMKACHRSCRGFAQTTSL